MNSGIVFVSVAIVSALAGAHVGAAAGNGQVAAAAVFIPSAEIADAVSRLPADPIGDIALRTLHIDNYNVGIAVVRRALASGALPPDAIAHSKITEVYHVLEGGGELVTGGRIVDPQPIPASDPEVRRVLGPSTIGTRIESGRTRHISVGDIVVIPPNTPHGFVRLDGNRIVYALIRIDGDAVLEVGGVTGHSD